VPFCGYHFLLYRTKIFELFTERFRVKHGMTTRGLPRADKPALAITSIKFFLLISILA